MRQLLIPKLIFLLIIFSVGSFAQEAPVMIDVASEADLTPGVLSALPENGQEKDSAVYIKDTAELDKALGKRGVLDLIDFTGGTDAATAKYPQGTLLIVEYASPVLSVEADNLIKERLSTAPQDPPIYYRRSGNYNMFLFDAKDELAANTFLGTIKYSKAIKWLGEDPFYNNRAERYFVETSLQIFFSTLMIIVILLGMMVVIGIGTGFVFFKVRDRHKASMTAFSDAGGMTRLNLDELSQ